MLTRTMVSVSLRPNLVVFMMRVSRPRRPGGMYGEGWPLEGMTSKFGVIGIGLLMIVGALMLLTRNNLTQKDLSPVEIQLSSGVYTSPKWPKSVLLPVTNARVLALHQVTFAAADSTKLKALKKGDVLIAWLKTMDAEKWTQGYGRKDFYQGLLLQVKNGEWIVDWDRFESKMMGRNSQGWWLIALGLILLPYQLIQKPKLPVWAAILLFTAAAVITYFFL